MGNVNVIQISLINTPELYAKTDVVTRV